MGGGVLRLLHEESAKEGEMDYSSLPQYPLDPPDPPEDEDAAGTIDCEPWLGMLAALWALFALVGQLLGFFDLLWR
jgi:hypothetical protein